MTPLPTALLRPSSPGYYPALKVGQSLAWGKHSISFLIYRSYEILDHCELPNAVKKPSRLKDGDAKYFKLLPQP